MRRSISFVRRKRFNRNSCNSVTTRHRDSLNRPARSPWDWQAGQQDDPVALFQASLILQREPRIAMTGSGQTEGHASDDKNDRDPQGHVQ